MAWTYNGKEYDTFKEFQEAKGLRQTEGGRWVDDIGYSRTDPLPRWAHQDSPFQQAQAEEGILNLSPGSVGTVYDQDGNQYNPDGYVIDAPGNPDISPSNPGPMVSNEPPDWYKPFEPAAPVEQAPVNMPDMFDRSPQNPAWTGPDIPGVPGNPIPGPEGGDFSPFGSPIGKLSDSKVYGGLPRSTGPFGVMGGYYGGNPYTGQDNPLAAAQAAALRAG
jgi:hypothetical protein